MSNFVYVATSLDGYIAASDGGLDWLSSVPVPEGNDLGFADFIKGMDAIVMGRVTFETVVGFGQGWIYPVPGIILSATMTTAPDDMADQVQFASGAPDDIVRMAGEQGFESLYIDGGKTIQSFLQANLIDEMIVTEIPILLGGGTRLFGPMDHELMFELVRSDVLIGRLVQRHYRRKR